MSRPQTVAPVSHGLDVQAYLTWALERVAACTQPDDYAALTPMAYEEAQKRAGD